MSKKRKPKDWFSYPTTDPLAQDMFNAVQKLPKRLQTKEAVTHSIQEFIRIYTETYLI